MAVRAYWKGSLKLSLVSCPVLLYPASTSSDKTRFHMINKETGNRLKQQMVDAETGDVVESNQKGRGYELSKGEYIEIEKEELEAVQIESNHTIDIDSFVPRDEIDKRYLNHPYYIAPDGKAEAMLRLDPSEANGGNRDVIVKYQLAGGAVQSGLLLDQGKVRRVWWNRIPQPDEVLRAM